MVVCGFPDRKRYLPDYEVGIEPSNYVAKALWRYGLSNDIYEDTFDRLENLSEVYKHLYEYAAYDFNEGRLDRSVYERISEMKPTELKTMIKRRLSVCRLASE